MRTCHQVDKARNDTFILIHWTSQRASVTLAVKFPTQQINHWNVCRLKLSCRNITSRKPSVDHLWGDSNENHIFVFKQSGGKTSLLSGECPQCGIKPMPSRWSVLVELLQSTHHLQWLTTGLVGAEQAPLLVQLKLILTREPKYRILNRLNNISLIVSCSTAHFFYQPSRSFNILPLCASLNLITSFCVESMTERKGIMFASAFTSQLNSWI